MTNWRFNPRTWNTLVLNVHIVSEALAEVAVDVLLGDIQPTGHLPHAEVVHIWHAAATVSIYAATVIVTVCTFWGLSTHANIQSCTLHLHDRVSGTLR